MYEITQIRMTKDEIVILEQAASILQGVCDTFESGCCGDCPLCSVCSKQYDNTPADLLYNCINALPKEREEK